MAAEIARLGRYDVVRILGEGAMGVVYEALDPRLHRTVAIKTILTSHLDSGTSQQYSQRFMREAQAVARLNHPGIVQIHDFGEENDVAYIVMEYVRGRELSSYFDADQRFAVKDAVRIMTELLDALEFAHQAGIVHRDVKPANVMLDLHGKVKLADFGVARVTDTERTLAGRKDAERTQAGAVIGTPAYMSPEQVTGNTVDHRTDIFSAGIILYQLLTAEKPFSGTGSWTIAKKIVQDEPPRPSTINVSISPFFDRVVSKALAKDVDVRFQSAREFAAALNRAVDGKVSEDDSEETVLQAIPEAPKVQPRNQTVTPPRAQPPSRPVAPSTGTQEVELEFWRAIKDGNDAEDFELYIEQFPSGVYANLARRKIAKLRGLESSAIRTSQTGKLRAEAEEVARRDAEERALNEAEARARSEAEERARQEIEELARKEAEEREIKEAEEREIKEAGERARKEAEDRARKEGAERARKQAEERAQREAEAKAKARREAEEAARREAEERARKEAEERAQREAEAKAKARREAEEAARREAEQRAQREAEAKAKARREAEEAARREAEARARKQAEEIARKQAEERAQREAEAQAKARREAEEAARREAQAQAKAKREAEERARKEAEERARKVVAEGAQVAPEVEARQLEHVPPAPQSSRKAMIAVSVVVVASTAAAAFFFMRTPATQQTVATVPQAALRDAVVEKPAVQPKQGATERKDEVSPAPAAGAASLAAPGAAAVGDIAVPATRESTAQENAKASSADKAKRQAEALAKRESDERAKRSADVTAKKDAEEKLKRETEQQEKLGAQQTAKRQMEETLAAELALWNATKTSAKLADYDEYLRRYPDGHFAALAKSAKETLLRQQQDAKELAAQRARLEEEKRKAKEQELSNQSKSQAREESLQRRESKSEETRKPGVFVPPTF